MPYSRNQELPAGVKVLPEHGQTIWRAAFNNSYSKGEDAARKIAWAAVEQVYKKNEKGEWVRKTLQSFVSLRMQALAGFDPLALVTADDLARIKAKNPHPFLQAYSICHEGVANPTVLGEQAKPITWFRNAVETLKSVLIKGVKFFIGHNEDNSTENREAVGEVIGSGEREIEGKLHHVVVGYFPNKDKVQDMDICSQESDWDLLPSPMGYIADKILKLTGIALSSSKFDKPAFSGAVRLGNVQAFEYQTISGNQNGAAGQKAPRRLQMSDIMSATFQELDAALRARNVFPSQVFTLDQIKADRNFAPVFEKAEKVDPLQKELEKVNGDLKQANDKIKTLENESNVAKRSAEFATAPKRLEKLAKDAGLTEKQTAFVLARLTDKVADLTDDGLKAFMGDQIEIYKAAVGADAKGTESTAGAGTSGAGTKTAEPDDFTKAVNNPMLAADLTD